MKAAASIASAALLVALSSHASAYMGSDMSTGAIAAVLGVAGGLPMLVEIMHHSNDLDSDRTILVPGVSFAARQCPPR